MILYFAGGESMNLVLKEAGAESVLFSTLGQHKKLDYLENGKNELLSFKNLFADSGAYTAWTKGDPIDIDDYINWLKHNEKHLTIYAPLDVIGDWKETKKNHEYMQKNGVNPVPVFHSSNPRAPYSRLEEICEEFDYIALGGVAGAGIKKEVLLNHFDCCFKIIGKHWKNGRKIKVHGFGVTTPRLMARYPFYSVDSTTWLNGGRFGQMFTWDVYKYKIIAASSKEMAILNNVELLTDYKARLRYTVKEFIKMQDHYTALWTKRGIVWND